MKKLKFLARGHYERIFKKGTALQKEKRFKM
jgi:hypothetical protein